MLIDEITSKEKREVSCGYDCFWELGNDNTIIQKQIRGNHIAIVKNGRAGHRVAVRDSKPELKNKINGGKKMSLKAIKNKDDSVIVRIDKKVPYERVVKVLDLLQKYNLNNLALVTNEEKKN